MRIGDRLDGLMFRLLRLVRRKAKPSGVLLVSSRGPAEMVFLSAVLPRFMRLADEREPVTLLCRTDAAGMSFLFPSALRIRRLRFELLNKLGTRWSLFRELYNGNWRLAVLLDHQMDTGAALVAATQAAGTGAMKGSARRGGGVRRLIDVGSPNQDKILRWSRYADELLDDRQEPQLAVITGVRLPTAARQPPTAVLMPFSGVRPRQLPLELWRLVIAALPSDWKVRVAGHSSDFDRNPEYASLFRLPNVVPETSDFERLTSVLRGSRMVVGVDTAALHLAVLLGVPTLCLASAAYVGAGVPYDDRVMPAHVHFFHTPMACQGCLGRCKFPLENGMFKCVEALDTDAMLAMVGDILARGAV